MKRVMGSRVHASNIHSTGPWKSATMALLFWIQKNTVVQKNSEVLIAKLLVLFSLSLIHM